MFFKHQYGTTIGTHEKKEKELPSGVPEHSYKFPEWCCGKRCGFHITEVQLEEVAELSGVLEGMDDYLEPAFRIECERHLPSPKIIEPAEEAEAYKFLKSIVYP